MKYLCCLRARLPRKRIIDDACCKTNHGMLPEQGAKQILALVTTLQTHRSMIWGRKPADGCSEGPGVGRPYVWQQCTRTTRARIMAASCIKRVNTHVHKPLASLQHRVVLGR